MCGISGYFVTDATRVRPKALQQLARNLLLGIENRGHDATGYAYVSLRDKAVYVAKAPIPASEFLKVDGHILTRSSVQKMPRAMILHTRAATQGSPNNNENNHPIYSKASGLCMIHNGWISNDDKLIETYDLKPDAEVDTEAYLKLIEKAYLTSPDRRIENCIQSVTNKIYGSIACAMIKANSTDTMWLWRDTGQLYLIELDWGWVFASTKTAAMDSVMASLSSFDGSILEAFEPPTSSLYTLSLRGKSKIDGIRTGSWNSMPKELTKRVSRTFVNGKLTNVRRARTEADGGDKNYEGYVSEDFYGEYDEYGDNWFDRHYQKQHRHDNSEKPDSSTRRYIPAISRRGSSYSNGNKESSPSGRWSWQSDPPFNSHDDRLAWQERAKKAQKDRCFCTPYYRCRVCWDMNKYFSMELPVEWQDYKTSKD